MYSFISMAVVSIVWVLWGYSLAFGEGNAIIGDLSLFGLSGIGIDQVEDGGIPTLLFVIFQMMFAIITPALITGAFVERFKFTTYLVFLVVWVTVVYTPVAHWVWASEGWLFKDGALDFAGGTVVHINAGMAAVAAAVLVGKRRDPRRRAPQRALRGPGSRPALVRVVRVQCRLRAGGQRRGRERLPGHQHSRGRSGPHLGRHIPGADGAHERRRGGVGSRSGTGRHHPSLGGSSACTALSP